MYTTRIYIVYQRFIIIRKDTEQTHEVFTRYIGEDGIYMEYTMYIPYIYHAYTSIAYFIAYICTICIKIFSSV
jgi:hypothetical protein